MLTIDSIKTTRKTPEEAASDEPVEIFYEMRTGKNGKVQLHRMTAAELADSLEKARRGKGYTTEEVAQSLEAEFGIKLL